MTFVRYALYALLGVVWGAGGLAAHMPLYVGSLIIVLSIDTLSGLIQKEKGSE